MSFILTLLTITLYYLSPADVLPSLAPYHIQQFILVPAVVGALFVLGMRPDGLQSPQCYLMIGLWFATVMSLIARYYLRGALGVFLEFGFVVCLYFLVSINVFSLARIRIFCIVLTLCAVTMTVLGILAYFTGYMEDKLLYQRVGPGAYFTPRIQGLGILHDPNDFAQYLLVALSFQSLFWKNRHAMLGRVAAIIASLILIFGIYLTGSRGAVFGLVAIAFVAISRRVGKVQALLISGVLFAILVAAQFGGGREMSLHEGSAAGRVEAWGTGIGDFKRDPLFGVGFGQFLEYNDMTAHNSFVLCFAELGLFGFFFWLGLIVTTILGLETLAKIPLKTAQDIEFSHYVNAIRSALYAFLATSWFLSQTYHPTIYILLALAGVLIYQGRKSFAAASAPLRWIPVTVVAQVAVILVIYITIRMRGL